MLQTRKNVFETNSSSTHSITLGGGEYLMDTSLVPNEEGFIDIPAYEFGWEYDTYRYAEAKASYALIYCLDWSGDNKDKHLSVLIDVIKDQTGAIGIKWSETQKSSWDFYPHGYIDHQSVEGGRLDYLFEDAETLRRFIFDEHSVLITDSDNYDHDDDN